MTTTRVKPYQVSLGWAGLLLCLACLSWVRERASGPQTSRHTTQVVSPRFAVDINRASVNELRALPNVGPALANRIVDYRQMHGPFAAVSDLEAVHGVGPVTIAQLSAMVHVRPPPEAGQASKPAKVLWQPSTGFR